MEDKLLVIKESDLAEVLTALRNDMGKNELVDRIEDFVFLASEVFAASRKMKQDDNGFNFKYETYTDYEKTKI